MAKKAKTTDQPTNEVNVEPIAPTKTAKAPGVRTLSAPAKNPKPAPAKKLSALDAAAKVLDETRAPMTSGELIEAMAKKGYWSSPNGQTPAATIYAAMIREIGKKGKASRFAKTERGKFARTKAR
jgi:HB1, ASXL, restriction endonuclease HTH domain